MKNLRECLNFGINENTILINVRVLPPTMIILVQHSARSNPITFKHTIFRLPFNLHNTQIQLHLYNFSNNMIQNRHSNMTLRNYADERIQKNDLKSKLKIPRSTSHVSTFYISETYLYVIIIRKCKKRIFINRTGSLNF